MEGGVLRTVILFAVLLGIGGLAVLFNPGQGYALSGSDFNAGRIIDDDVFTNKKSMSPQEIQNFLVSKNSTCLKDFKTLTLHDTNNDGNADEPYGKGSGNKARASKVIWQAAQIYDLNPQVLLVTLQKEQGLITRGDCPNWRYKTALGYGCPDGEPCDQSAYGLTRQLDYGSWHFRGFYNDSMSFVPFTPGKYDIDYHPDSGCGSSRVNIRNRATAALYSYTPYQPNQAALNNLDGLGNSCSAYGNRNFWREFTRWFGSPTPSTDIVLLRNKDSGKIYVIDKKRNLKIHIATGDAYKAWGFNKLSLNSVRPEVLKSYENGGSLKRLAYERKTGKAYFVDNQTVFHIPNPNMASVWNFNLSGIPRLPQKVVQYLSSSRLSPLVKSPVGSEVYMMDSGKLRHYPSPTVLYAWEINGRTTKISEDFFCKGATGGESCDFRWSEEKRIGYPKARSPKGKTFFINSGNKHWLSLDMNEIYTGGLTKVSQATLNRFFDAKHATALISQTYDHRIHLLNKGSIHHIGSPQLYNHWKPNGNGRITNVSKAFMNMLKDGKSIDRFTASAGNNTYYMNQKKYDLNNLKVSNPIELKPETAELYKNDEMSTPFVTSKQTSKIFFLSHNNKHHVASIFDLKNMRNNTDLGIMNLPHSLLKNMEAGQRTSYQFKDNSDNTYVFDNGSYRQVVESKKWDLDPKLTLNTASLNKWFGDEKASLNSDFKVGNKYGVIRDGTLFTDKNTRLGELWGANDSSPVISQRLASRFEQKTLSPFVTSDSPHIYIYDGNDFSYISSPAVLHNLGYRHFNGTMVLSEDYIKPNKSDRNATYLLSKEDGVMDNGERRRFADGAASSWVATGGVNSLAGDGEGQALIDLLEQNTNDTNVGRLITSPKTSKYYCMENGKKRWTTNSGAVEKCESEELTTVSHKLIKQIPTGKNIY